MKIKPAHLDIIVAALLTHHEKLMTEMAKYKIYNHSKTRYQWDAFRFVQLNGDTTKWICDVLYPYMNDEHIETALNAAFKRVNLVY